MGRGQTRCLKAAREQARARELTCFEDGDVLEELVHREPRWVSFCVEVGVGQEVSEKECEWG